MPPKTRPKPPQRYVYVRGPASGLQKIGLATDPHARLAALKTASPFPLVLHLAVPVAFGQAHAVEARAHLALASRRASGEWFNVQPAEAVAAVRAAAGQEGLRAPSAGARSDAGALPLFAYVPPRRPAAVGNGERRPAWRRAYQKVMGRLADGPSGG